MARIMILNEKNNNRSIIINKNLVEYVRSLQKGCTVKMTSGDTIDVSQSVKEISILLGIAD